MDELTTALLRTAAAIALGLMIGLQREFSHRQQQQGSTPAAGTADQGSAAPNQGTGDVELFAGTRTFALISLSGWIAAELARLLGDPTVIWLGFIAVAALLVAAHVLARGERGLTTEVAALATFLLGVLCHAAPLALPIALAVAISVLLAIKLYTRSLVQALTPDDVYATLKFAVMTAIVLPVLPHTPVLPSPFDVWVPWDIWLMAVLISAIGFAGYLLHKVFGPRQGTAIAGLLGGLVSSTAATLSFARASAIRTAPARLLAGAVLLAWSTMFLRVGLEVLVVQHHLLAQVWPLVVLPLLAGLPFAWLALRTPDATDGGEQPTLTNPFELGPALGFAGLYAGVLLVADVAFDLAGDTGLYAASFVSGFVDVDAITLSLAGRTGATDAPLPHAVAARGIALALLANTLVKCALVAAIAGPHMRTLVLRAGAAMAAALLLGFVLQA